MSQIVRTPMRTSTRGESCAAVACLIAGLLAFAPIAPPALGAGDGPAHHVNSRRIQESLEKLAEFGKNPDGGVTRLGFSAADMAARDYVMALMRNASLTVRVDPAGNIFGHRDGTEKLPVILFGSHIDSVIHGGNFDGTVGSLGAIEVMHALGDAKLTTRHPLEAVIWTNEEGNHFGMGSLGSGIAAGLIGKDVLKKKDEQGLTLADWLRRYGQEPARFDEARIPAGALAAYVELHIEQGANLFERRIPIGVVQGIVGIRRWRCVVSGTANHAGTTPMNRRHDALIAASRAALAVREVVRAEPGRQVGTVGYLNASPGAVNVIAGSAEFPVELRDLDSGRIQRLWRQVQAKLAVIDRDEGVRTSCDELDAVAPAITTPAVREAIRDAARSLHLAMLELPSGAGHDAQEIARIAPMGMIFVPSQDGISHSPKERTSYPDIDNGVETLYRTILLLDGRLDPTEKRATRVRRPTPAWRELLSDAEAAEDLGQ